MEGFLSIVGASRLQEHFTDAEEIRTLMADLLGDMTGLKVLEPAVGRGAFIEAISGHPAQLDAVDVNADSLRYVQQRFPRFVRPIRADFIDLFVTRALERSSILLSSYDAAISNPPYGLRIPIDYRRVIKRKYPDVYARESFGLFLYFTLSLLREGGRYVFILPDTFLHSAYHRPLRRELLKRGAPTHIIQFRSSRFETVNFGYGNLCIIAGNAAPVTPTHEVCWVDATSFEGRLSMQLFDGARKVSGTALIETCDSGWIYPDTRAALDLGCPSRPLGELAECRTGIYTGDNSRFVGFDRSLNRRRGNGHAIDWTQDVRRKPLTLAEKTQGITHGPKYVPLIRGGHRQAFDETRWAVDWSTEAVSFYATNKKARLQNSRFYFRAGLAVPMVTSGRISASLMRDAVFDQGVVGVFPDDEAFIAFLLIYLNSDFVATTLKKAINGSANNSANYVKRLPVPLVSRDLLQKASEVVDRARAVGWEHTDTERRSVVDAATNPDSSLSLINGRRYHA